MNNNNNQIEITEQDLNNLSEEISKKTNHNKEIFKEIVYSSNLPVEKIKQELPNLDKEWKKDTIEPIKTASDQEKINAYDRLQVQELPFDWKPQLARLKYLESQLADYTQIKEELKTWTDTFGEQKPQEVENKIEQQKETNEKNESELKEKITDLESKLVSVNSEKEAIIQQLSSKITELEGKLNEWVSFFSGKEFSDIKEEWEDLQQRPDISISENEFYDDYAKRKSKEQSEAEEKELIRTKEKILELEQEKQRFLQNIKKIEENWRTQRYNLSEPVINSEQARKAIAELLEKTEKEWETYLNGESQNPILTLSFQSEGKKKQAYQILEWIKEARTTQEYQKLFELWSNGKEYKQEFDFDGSLYLLWKYLEVKD